MGLARVEMIEAADERLTERHLPGSIAQSYKFAVQEVPAHHCIFKPLQRAHRAIMMVGLGCHTLSHFCHTLERYCRA